MKIKMAKVMHIYFLLLASVIVCCMLSGCMGKSPTPNFFILTPMTGEYETTNSQNATQNLIGIGPIKLADYLDQPKIVIRTSDNQLKLAEFEQWGGSIKDNITSVLAENIGLLLSNQKIQIYPWRLSSPIDYQIMVDIVRFDGMLGQEAWLIARWSIIDSRNKTVIATNRTSIRESVATADYPALVSAQSRLLSRLSKEIAGIIITNKSRGKETNTVEKKKHPIAL